MKEGEPILGSQLEVYRAADAPSIYSSSVRIWATPFEFVFVFGQLDASVRADQMPRMKEVGQVSMSPQHAKAMARVLAGRVAQWEANHGEIPESQLGAPLALAPTETPITQAAVSPE